MIEAERNYRIFRNNQGSSTCFPSKPRTRSCQARTYLRFCKLNYTHHIPHIGIYLNFGWTSSSRTIAFNRTDNRNVHLSVMFVRVVEVRMFVSYFCMLLHAFFKCEALQGSGTWFVQCRWASRTQADIETSQETSHTTQADTETSPAQHF